MAVFFLLIGLEIKRKVLDGQFSTWSRRILPGVGALGGMAVPAAIFLAFNGSDPVAARGWAIPTATDIAFALGVLSLLGPRVPVALKVFLTALAIIDDLGAVIIIALFYTAEVSTTNLACAGGVLAVLITLSLLRVRVIWLHMALGLLPWFLCCARACMPPWLAFCSLSPFRCGRRQANPMRPIHRCKSWNMPCTNGPLSWLSPSSASPMEASPSRV